MRRMILALCLFPTLAAAEETLPPSLFLTQQEQGQQTSSNPSRTTLEALLYYSPTDWRVWLNGRMFTPETFDPTISIIAVTAQDVTLRQQLGSQSRSFTLVPYQSYDWVQGNTSEKNSTNDNDQNLWLSRISQAIQLNHLTALSQECYSLRVHSENNKEMQVVVSEVHNEKCGGDPAVAPSLFFVHLDKETGKIWQDDVLEEKSIMITPPPVANGNADDLPKTKAD